MQFHGAWYWKDSKPMSTVDAVEYVHSVPGPRFECRRCKRVYTWDERKWAEYEEMHSSVFGSQFPKIKDEKETITVGNFCSVSCFSITYNVSIDPDLQEYDECPTAQAALVLIKQYRNDKGKKPRTLKMSRTALSLIVSEIEDMDRKQAKSFMRDLERKNESYLLDDVPITVSASAHGNLIPVGDPPPPEQEKT